MKTQHSLSSEFLVNFKVTMWLQHWIELKTFLDSRTSQFLLALCHSPSSIFSSDTHTYTRVSYPPDPFGLHHLSPAALLWSGGHIWFCHFLFVPPLPLNPGRLLLPAYRTLPHRSQEALTRNPDRFWVCVGVCECVWVKTSFYSEDILQDTINKKIKSDWCLSYV